LSSLKNLLKTWSILAPQELSKRGNDEYILEKTKKISIYPECISLYDSFLSEAYSLDMLQGYLQRCIEARNEWDWTLVSGQNYSPKVYDATVWVNGSEFIIEDNNSPVIALMLAYLTAIAAQRPLKCGIWQHFRGGTYFVKATATWSGQKINYQSFAGSYFLEEDTSVMLQLILDPKDETKWIYNANNDYGDRVFYSDKSGLWARKTEIFLSLVKPNQEHEGVLRFVEVGNADAA
jgi:hypothetical protein